MQTEIKLVENSGRSKTLEVIWHAVCEQIKPEVLDVCEQ
jgi:hypothetical protein